MSSLKPSSHTRQMTLRLVLSGLFLAIGYVLPFVTGQLRELGQMLLPMHFPVFLCGLICGWKYGAAVGLLLPITRSLIFGMPVFYPMALAMAVELAVYGFTVGICYGLSKKKGVIAVYVSLLIAMLSGRIAWGIMQVILLGIRGTGFSLSAFFAGAFFNAIPGIILQLILIPATILALTHAHLLPLFSSHETEDAS